MLLLMDAHSYFPVHYNNSNEKKKVDKPFTLVHCECRMLEYEHYSIITRVLIAVRPEQHTLISVFKLNSCKLCQFKHKSQRMRACTRSEKICACAHQKRANPRLRTRANIKLSLKYCVFRNCQNARLGKYPIADIAGWTYSISALDQCILLKWQHFLNINQKATTKNSLLLIELLF